MKQMLRQLKADGVLVTLQPGAVLEPPLPPKASLLVQGLRLSLLLPLLLQAQELGWSQITLAKVLTATGKKGKKGSGSGPKFKMVYALKKDIPPAGGSKPSAPEDAAQ